MGSFAYTCAISGLPIEAGDKVRYLLLTKNPYHNGAENTCYIHDLWFPRTFPLKGSYNDYGSVEKVTAGVEREIWLEGLEKDMVERGWGENSCHDVPTKKGLKFDELLNAIQEGRILVERETDHYSSMDDLLERLDVMTGKKKKVEEDTRSPEEKRDSKIAAGVPTMYRVQKAAEKLDLAIYDGAWSKPTIMIDETERGEVRVRCHCMYGEKLNPNDKFTAGAAVKQQVAVLEKLQAALSDYATMISTSADGCGVTGEDKRTYTQPDTELLIRPKPGTPNGTLNKYRDNKQPLPVGHAMIREDVWQALIKNNTVETWNGKNFLQVGIDAFYDGINKFVETVKKELSDKSPASKLLRRMSYESESRDLTGAWIAAKDMIPFTVGLGTHFGLMMEKEEVPEGFFKTVAEFAFINSILAQTRYQWRTSSSAGPQFGEWERHENLLKSLADVAHKHAEKQKAERGKW
jgi:hypothetical protein